MTETDGLSLLPGRVRHRRTEAALTPPGVFDPRYNLALHRAGARRDPDGYLMGRDVRIAHQPWSTAMAWAQACWVLAVYVESLVLVVVVVAAHGGPLATPACIGLSLADVLVTGVPFVTAYARVRADQGQPELLCWWAAGCAALTSAVIAAGLSRLGQAGHSVGYRGVLLATLLLMAGFVLTCLATAVRARPLS
jgi:hypothetical protein